MTLAQISLDSLDVPVDVTQLAMATMSMKINAEMSISLHVYAP